jgi:hypothetical protein
VSPRHFQNRKSLLTLPGIEPRLRNQKL